MGFMDVVRVVRERWVLSMLFRHLHSNDRRERSHPQDGEKQAPGGDIAETIPRQQRGADFYDRVHTAADSPETPALYKPLFRKVLETLRDCGSRSILEVGCGSGFLAEMILQESGTAYRGFDFSPVAIYNAGRRTGRPELLARADALDPRCYACDYDTIVCTEVLEHIDADLDVIRLWRDGALCVCTVPNFDFDGHVRFFRRSEEVVARYGDLVDIRAVIRVARPIIPDGSLRSYLRNLRWSRDDPSRFLGFMGVQTFDRLGGWFLFYGAKKPQRG
jgi:SAM-dependent methyltransferase